MNRFWSKVDIKTEDECWEWKASKNSAGRGTFYLNGHLINASRAAWILTYGEISNSGIVCHTCDNLLCVNPNHLYLGSHCDNSTDRSTRNPTPPEISGYRKAKLYSGEVWLIRRLLEAKVVNQRFIASMFKVSQWVICNINRSEKVLCREGFYC